MVNHDRDHGFSAGDYAEIQQDNDAAVMYTQPEWNTSWAEGSVGQVVEITGVNGNVLWIDPPLHITLDPNLNPQVRRVGLVTGAGVEHLHVKRLDSGDLVRTGDQTLVAIVFTDDKSMLKIRSNSDVRIRAKREKKGVAKRVFMNLGQLWARVTKGQTDFRVETPSGIAAVKGTEFYGTVDDEGTFTVIGISGLVELFNQFGSVMVRAGQMGRARKGQAPTVQEAKQYEDWAEEMQIEEKELEIEFEDASGQKKTLRIRYREE